MLRIMTTSMTTAVALAGTALFSSNVNAATVSLKNDRISAEWKIHDRMLWPDSLKDLTTGETLALRGELFGLTLANAGFIHGSGFKLVGEVKTEPLPVNPNASRFAERLPGSQLTAEMVSADGNLHV